MKAYFGRRYLVSASHRLHTPALTAEENRAAYGKCNNAHGHGHNYVVEVLVGGAVDAATGMVVDLVALDRTVGERILGSFRSRQPESRSTVCGSRAHNGEFLSGDF